MKATPKDPPSIPRISSRLACSRRVVSACLILYLLPCLGMASVSSTELILDDEKSSEKSVRTSALGAPHDSRSELAIRRGVDFLIDQQNGVGAFSSSFNKFIYLY